MVQLRFTALGVVTQNAAGEMQATQVSNPRNKGQWIDFEAPSKQAVAHLDPVTQDKQVGRLDWPGVEGKNKSPYPNIDEQPGCQGNLRIKFTVQSREGEVEQPGGSGGLAMVTGG